MRRTERIRALLNLLRAGENDMFEEFVKALKVTNQRGVVSLLQTQSTCIISIRINNEVINDQL